MTGQKESLHCRWGCVSGSRLPSSLTPLSVSSVFFPPSLPHSYWSQRTKLNYKLWICPSNLTMALLLEEDGTSSLGWLAVCLLYSLCGQMVQAEPLRAPSMPPCFWIPNVAGRETIHLVCRRMTSWVTFSLSLFFWKLNKPVFSHAWWDY